MLTHAKRQTPDNTPPVSLHDKLLWSHITDDEVLVGYDGECSAGLVLKGLSYYGISSEALAAASAQLAQSVLRALPEGISVSVIEMRLKATPHALPIVGSSAFAREVQTAHANHLSELPLFATQTVLLLVANPFNRVQQHHLRSGCGDVSKWHPKRFVKTKTAVPAHYTEQLEAMIAELVQARAQLQAQCDRFTPAVLMRTGTLTWYHVLSLPINGLHAVVPNTQPHNQLLTFTARRDVCIDDKSGTLEFADENAVRCYGAVLSQVAINAQHTSIDHLVRRCTLPFAYYSVHTYTPWSRSKSQRTLKRQLEELIAAGDMSDTAQHQLRQAQGEVDDNALLLGNYTASHLIVAPSQAALAERVRLMQTLYNEADMPLRRETDSLQTLWLAMMVGNRSRAKRVIRGLTNHNVADIVCPLQDNTGHRASHLGEAVSVFPTLHRTPYYFNWHLPGTAAIDVQFGATLVVGAVGSGKNVFVCKALCDTQRFSGKMLLLDYNQASYVFVAAMGGEYVTLDLSGTVGFAPLQYAEGGAVIEIMCLEKDETELPTPIANQLAQSIRDLISVESSDSVTLLLLAEKYLPADFPRREQLARFLPDGKYGALFNSVRDTLTFDNPLTAIDLTFLTNPDNNLPFAVKGAVLQHIMSRMNAVKRGLKGALFTLVIDEFYNYIKDPYWCGRIEDVFASWRKDNGYPILLQQDVPTIAHSSIAGAIKTNLSTAVCFANTEAEASDYAVLTLAPFETETVRKLANMGRFMALVKQKNQGSEIINVDATHLAPYLPALSSNQHLAARCRLLQKTHGQAYPAWYAAYSDEVHALRNGQTPTNQEDDEK